MFRTIFAHPQERDIVICSMWYNDPRLLSVEVLECGDTDCVFCVQNVARSCTQNTQSVSPHSRPPADNNLGTLHHML